MKASKERLASCENLDSPNAHLAQQKTKQEPEVLRNLMHVRDPYRLFPNYAPQTLRKGKNKVRKEARVGLINVEGNRFVGRRIVNAERRSPSKRRR